MISMTARSELNKTWNYDAWLIGGIILVSVLIRAYKLTAKGLLFWDEGLFLMGAKFFSWRVEQLWLTLLNWLGFSSSMPASPMGYPGFPVFIWKPLHVILISLFSAFVGLGDYTGAILSVICAALQVALVYMVAKRMFDARIAVFSSFILALMPYHIFYSRLNMHEIDSTLFLLASVVVLYFGLEIQGRSRLLALFSSGLLFGASITTSYRWIIIVPLPYLFILIGSIRGKGSWHKQLFILVVAFTTGLLVIVATVNMVYYITFSPHYLRYEPGSYLEAMRHKFATESRFDFEHPFYYLKQLWRMDSALLFCLYMLGMLLLALRRDVKGLYILAFGLFPLLFYSFASQRLFRTITVCLPFFAIASGYCLNWIINMVARKLGGKLSLAVATLLCAVIIISVSSEICSIHALRSGYGEAIDYMSSHKGLGNVSTMTPIFAFYLGKQNSLRMPVDWAGAVKARELGAVYLIVDWERYVWESEFLDGLMNSGTMPLMVFENHYVLYHPVLRENYLPLDARMLPKRDPNIAKILIFDLNQAINALQR